jgi:hypothetical protein
MPNKIFIVTLCSFILLVAASITEAQQQSRFTQYNLKHGVSVQIPSHWQIIDKQIMDQVDTITELLSKVHQGDNDIIIAANYVVSDKTLATVRISVRTRSTFTQEAIRSMGQAEIDKQDILSRTMLVNGLKQLNDTSTKVSAFKTTKEKLSGYICVRTDYQTIQPSQTMNTSIYVIYLGNRAVKMTLAYENSHTYLLQMVMDKIKRSLVIKKTITSHSTSMAQEPMIIQSKEHRFSWPIPAMWEITKPLTSAQYAVQMKGSEGAYNCSILVSPKKFSLDDLIKDQKTHPRVYFNNAVLPRFPDSKFLASSISKLGSQNALLTEYIYTFKNLDLAVSFQAYTLVSVWKDNFYIMTFECPTKDAAFGKTLFQQLIRGFSFTE